MDAKDLERAGLSPEQIAAVLGLENRETAALNQRLEQAETQLNDERKRAAALREIQKFSPKDPELTLNLMDLSRVQMDEDGGLEGLEAQIQALQARAGFLFHQPSPQGGLFPQPAEPHTTQFDMNEFLRR